MPLSLKKKGGAEIVDNLGGDKNFKELFSEQKDKRMANIKSEVMDKIRSRMRGGSLRQLKNLRPIVSSISQGTTVAPFRVARRRKKRKQAVKRLGRKKRKSKIKRKSRKKRTKGRKSSKKLDIFS